MTLYTAEDRQTIEETIEFLISEGREIAIHMEGQRTSYTSRVLKANYGGVQSRYGSGPHLVMGRLVPEHGNTLIEPGSHLVAKFILSETSCRFKTDYLGPRSDAQESELVMSFPASIELPERRTQRRSSDEIPEFISVVLTSKNGSKKDQNYEFAVVDYSTNGVGILVSEKDSELAELIKEGDRLQDITLFAPHTMLKVDGTIRHKSKQQGKQGKDSYVLGIEFDETLMDLGAP